VTSARGIRWGLLPLLLVLIGPMATRALAETRQVSVGNYWFEDDARHDRTQIIVNQGDQITFTIREGIYPPHTVDVDELGIHSPDLLLGATYTTPPLNTAGTFRLYCRPHEQRGHVTTLAVRATTPTTSALQPQPHTSAPPTTAGSGQPPVVEGPQPVTPAPQPVTPPPQPASAVPQPATPAPGSSAPRLPPPNDPAPATTLTPVGVGQADPESMARIPEPAPGSLDDLIGRREARGAVPWTRALRLLLLAAVPILGAAGYALARPGAPERGPSRKVTG